MFGPFLILYLFLAACGSGMLFFAALIKLANRRAECVNLYFASLLRSLLGRSFALGTVLVVLSALCLVFDLGVPSRFMNLLLHPSFTILTFGTIVILLQIVLGAGLAACCLLDGGSNGFAVPSWCVSAACAMCLPVSLALMGYVGVLFSRIEAVALWNTPWLPLLFALSALSMGIAAIRLELYFDVERESFEALARRLHAVHIPIVAGELLTVLAFTPLLAGAFEGIFSIAALKEGMLESWLFFGGVLGAGIVAPLGETTWCLAKRRPYDFPMLDLACLTGGFCLRCLVLAGFGI